MVSSMLSVELKNSIGKNIILFAHSLRFEGKILDCDGSFIKYFDKHKDKIRYIKLSQIEEWEVGE